MKVSIIEMEGLLHGKCVPAKMLVNESLAAFLVRQFDALHEKLSAAERERDELKRNQELNLKIKQAMHERFTRAETELARRDAAARDPFGYLRVVSGLSFQIMEGAIRPPDRSGDSVGPWFPIWTTTQPAAIIPDGLVAAVNRLLDSDGSRGTFSAIRRGDALAEVERLLAAAPAPGGDCGNQS